MAIACAATGASIAAPALQPLTLARAQTLQYAVDGIIERGFDIDGSLLILSRTGTFAGEGEAREARLYATLFAPVADGFQQQWQIKDQVRDCPLDLTLDFTAEPVAVADADADGVNEVWVSYRLACQGDVSPTDLKLIGYEGGQKLALRGTSRLSYGEHTEGGSYTADAAVKAAPAIAAFADAYWQRVRETGIE